MRFNDLNEYGMTPGAPTPSGQQGMGASAKSSSASAPQPQAAPASPSTQKQSPSPSTQGTKPQAEPVIAKAKELDVDFEYPDEQGNVIKVVSPVNTGLNKDAVVVQNQKTKEYFTLQPEDKIALPQVNQDDMEEPVQEDVDDLIGRKKDHLGKKIGKTRKKLKRLIRANKFQAQGPTLFEINFNDAVVIKSTLDAPIRCGFEAECVWPGYRSEEEDGEFLDAMNWDEVSDLIWDQEGQYSVNKIKAAHQDWLMDLDSVQEKQYELVNDEVNSIQEFEEHLNSFAESEISYEEMDDHRDTVMGNLESAKDEGDENSAIEFKERESWDDDAWYRELIEVRYMDEYRDWLTEMVNDDGSMWSEAMEIVGRDYPVEEWMRTEYGTWAGMLSDYDIYLVPEESAGGVEDVANDVRTWAERNSKSSEVEAGSYHQGKSVDNDYWRVEEDSSIEDDDLGAGAEIISPVYDTPREMLREMNSLFAFMESEEVVTNSSTGLHITMSMGGDTLDEVNALKLAVLLGDQYVLKQFDRENNKYSKSQMKNLQIQAQRMAKEAKKGNVHEVDLQFQNLEKALNRAIDLGKFTSINFKDARNEQGNQLIEFRIAGGDNYHEKFDEVAKGVVRYGATMQAAYDPNAFRKDYLKAVIKVLTAGEDPAGAAILKKHNNTDLPNTTFVSAVGEFLKSNPDKLDMVEVVSQAYTAKNKGDTQQAQHLFKSFMSAMTSMVKDQPATWQPSGSLVRGMRSGFKEFGVSVADVMDVIQKNVYHAKNNFWKYDDDHKPEEIIKTSAKALASILRKPSAVPQKQMYKIPYNFNTQVPFIRYGAYHDRQGNKKETIKPEDIKLVDRDDQENLDRAYMNLGKEGTPEAEQAQQYLVDFQKKYGFGVPKTYNDQSPHNFVTASSTDGELARQLIDNGINLYRVNESAFDKFGSLPLQEQLELISRVDKKKLDEVYKKTREGAVPDHNVPDDFKELMSKPLLASDVKRQMEAYFILPDPSMLQAFRQQRSVQGDDADLRPILKSFAQAQLHPTQQSNITEARGVAARTSGEQYINNADPADTLTIQDISVIPDNASEFESREDLETALDAIIPDDGVRVNDNQPNAGTKAAIIALVTDTNGKAQYWVRFLRAIPPQGIMGAWQTLRGYKYGKGAAQESLPLKPSDVLPGNRFLTTRQIASNINKSVSSAFGTSNPDLVIVMNDAVKHARTNDSSPIQNGAPYFNVVQKYAGEYLGPLALIDGGNMMGDTPQMLEAYGLTSLKGSAVLFPDDTAYELVDSIIKTPNGDRIGVSSKAHTGGGAASSLSGIAKQITPEMEEQYPLGTEIIEILGTSSSTEGPLKVAQKLGVISGVDYREIMSLGKQSRNPRDIKSKRLQKLLQRQGMAPGSDKNANYRTLYHILTAIVNTIIPMVNQNAEFEGAMKAALNNNNFIQLMTKGKQIGNDITLDYYTKYPAVFAGSPKLYNKSYFVTGQKGRLGFKLK